MPLARVSKEKKIARIGWISKNIVDEMILSLRTHAAEHGSGGRKPGADLVARYGRIYLTLFAKTASTLYF